MGAFFTNVQLRTVDLDKSVLTDKVIDYIIRLNAEAGFVKVDNEDEADKTVIISPSEQADWMSVYDEETEGQGARKLNKLAAGLSKHFKTTTLSIIVNDSDSVYVGISVNGTLKDAISNLTKKADLKENKSMVWSEMLVNNHSFNDIRKAWQENDLFAEDFLTQLAKFTNLDREKLLIGYEYMSEEWPDEGIKLNFAQKDKKKAAELGLTKLTMIAGAGLVYAKGGEKQETEWIITNQGSFSNGLDIVIAGESIEHGLVIPEKVKASYIKYKDEKQNEFTAPFVETVATTGQKIFYARLEDIYIPKGYQPTYPMTPKEAKRYGKAWYDPAIRFNIDFIGGKEGNGELFIFFSPLNNREEGSYCVTLMKT